MIFMVVPRDRPAPYKDGRGRRSVPLAFLLSYGVFPTTLFSKRPLSLWRRGLGPSCGAALGLAGDARALSSAPHLLIQFVNAAVNIVEELPSILLQA